MLLFSHQISPVIISHVTAFVKQAIFDVRNIENSKGKGKAIPLQAWSGPEGSQIS